MITSKLCPPGSRLIRLFCFSIMGAMGSSLLTAQTIAPLPVERVQATPDGRRSAEFRQRELSELAEQAQFVEQQYGLIKRIVRAIEPVVAHIEARKSSASGLRKDAASQGSFIEEAGSGVVIQHNQRFYIITNYHVIEDSAAEDIRIEADGRWFSPTRIVHDRETDLSVLFTDLVDLVPAEIGNSDEAEIGDFVVAIGSPFGLSHSVSYGIISAKGRRDLELGPQGVQFQDFIQTDAAINPGNSGGPLIDLRGRVIGINTAIASNSGGSDGIGFSIPSKMAMRIARDLIDYGRVERGFLGVSLDARFTPTRAVSLGLVRPHGARVSAITPDSPAAESPISIGDIVLEFDGVTIVNDSHLVTRVSLTKVGKSVPVKVFRSGRIESIQVTVGSRDKFADDK